MSTALLSFYTPDYQPLVDVTGPVKDAYCARHGYRHIVKHAPYKKPGLYYAFDRLYYLRDLLFGDLPEGRDIETVLVINSHAQIMNHSIEIPSFLDSDHDFYITKDVGGLNAGVFIVRKTEWLKSWLDHLLSFEEVHQSKIQFEQTLIWENWERPEFVSRIKICPHNAFNSYLYRLYNWPDTTPGDFRKGDFVLHIPGRSVFAHPHHSLMQSRILLFGSPEITDNIIR